MSKPLQFQPVAEFGTLPEGRMLGCSVDGRLLVVCHTRDGLHALDDICPHAYARMSEGRLRGTRLICPLHGASFDIRDGRVLTGPATRALQAHRVRLQGSTIEVALDPAAPPQPEPF